MPIVDIKGVGKAKFPDGMSADSIREFLRQKYSQQAINGKSDILQPVENIAAPYEKSLVEKIGTGISDTLTDTGIISNRYGANQIGENIATLGEFLPGIGDATAGDEFGRAAAQGDKFGMAMAGMAGIPIAGDALKKAGRMYKVHNVTPEGLLKADEFGGIPSPSIAIAGRDSGFDSFGNISLVGSKDSFIKDPTFASDVYSPRTPKGTDIIDPSQAREEAARVGADVDPRIDAGFESQFSADRLGDDIDRLSDSIGNKASFLKGIGKDVNPDRFTSKPAKFNVPEWVGEHGFSLDGLITFKKFEDPVFAKKADNFVTEIDPDKDIAEWWDNGELSREGQKMVLSSLRKQKMARDTANAGPQFDRMKARVEIDKQITKNQKSFDSYISDQKSRLSKGKVFKKWNPKTGTSKNFDYNLDNAVKLMKGNIRGGEGFNYGVGSIRAQVAPQLKSMKQITDRRGQIVGEDQMTMVKEGFDSRLDNLYDELKDSWAYSSDPSYTDFAEGLQSAAKGDYSDFKELTSNQKSELSGFFDELANAPTNYFEVKPQRAVDIGEFYGAAVPYGTPKSVVDGLRSKGLKIERYHADERIGAIEKLNVKSKGNVFFSGAGAAILYGATKGSGEEENNSN